MRNHGLALQFATEDLQGDKEVALAAVRVNGLALQFVSAELRADPEVALVAVQQNGDALLHCAEVLRELHHPDVAVAEKRLDVEVALAAVERGRADLRAVKSAELGIPCTGRSTGQLWRSR